MKLTDKSEIESFLEEFKVKLKIFDVIFERREKNLQALLDLEITPADRIEYLDAILTEDYISGPNKDENEKDRFPNWEFGLSIKNRDVYIKISLNKSNKSVICMSFHPTEFPLKYKFKQR